MSMAFSQIYSSTEPVWEEKETIPFNELILSWNGLRPAQGKWTFYVSLKEGEWLKYAEWGPEGQGTFHSVGEFAESYQDAVTPKELCTSFRVKVEGEDLSTLRSLTVCVSNLERHAIHSPAYLPSVLLPVGGQSQMILNHPRCKDFCSPTATTTALNYLLGNKKIDPVAFAQLSHDDTFDIHGNWILNTAEAYNQTQIGCHVERLSDFSALHAHLMRGEPVVVSVKGALPGAPKVYSSGHLICIIGFDGERVHCIDSAFPDDASTRVSYLLEDFLRAWGVRKNLAYVFRV